MSLITSLESGLTIGEVAGVIAGTLHVMQTVLPLLLAFTLIGVISGRQFEAATWVAIGSLVQGSQWPLITRSIPGNITGEAQIRWRVFLFSVVSILAVLATVLAGFLTPQPLGEYIRPSHKSHWADFRYVPDTSFTGIGTLQVPENKVGRLCQASDAVWWTDCPFSIYNDSTVRNQDPDHIVVNSSIPEETIAPFAAGTTSRGVAGPQDIRYRNWYMQHYQYIDNDLPGARGSFRPLESFVLDEGYRLVEGLVVDGINGGVGLRNHTIPIDMELGARWSEDLLWITPVTSCTSTNLTLHFSISSEGVSTKVDGYLTDEGGFASLDPNVPLPRWDDDDPHWMDVGTDPDLQHRAYTAAWWNNQFAAKVLDIKSSSIGENYTGQFDVHADLSTPDSLIVENMDGGFLDDVWKNISSYAPDFGYYGRRCAGFDEYNPSNSTKPYIRCGYLYTPPSPAHPGQSWRRDLGSDWSQNLYVCASSVQASIKTVTFNTNNTSTGLENILVVNVTDKVYDADGPPLWGVEKVDDFKISGINLFWGLIGDAYENSQNLETRRAESIYLPAASQDPSLPGLRDTFAAGTAFTAAWNDVYSNAGSVAGVSLNQIPNYSGETNYAMTLKWRELSTSTIGASQILNLIWTDLVAFSVVCSRTGLETKTSAPSNAAVGSPDSIILGQKQVHRNIRIITYADIRYAIPALIIALLFILCVISSIVLGCMKRVSWAIMKHHVTQTSMARVFTQLQFPDYATGGQDVGTWLKMAGGIPMVIKGKDAVKSEFFAPDIGGAGAGAGEAQRGLFDSRSQVGSTLELLPRGGGGGVVGGYVGGDDDRHGDMHAGAYAHVDGGGNESPYDWNHRSPPGGGGGAWAGHGNGGVDYGGGGYVRAGYDAGAYGRNGHGGHGAHHGAHGVYNDGDLGGMVHPSASTSGFEGVTEAEANRRLLGGPGY